MTFAHWLDDDARRVNGRLLALLSLPEAGRAPGRLLAAMRHAVLGGGKRLRPFLVIESAAMFGLPREEAVDCAAAFELAHCYSLVHDDLPAMDDDDTRRGLPTVHRAFDEWTAILAGDALQTLAFELLSRPAGRGGAAVGLALVQILARAAGAAGMAGGQCLDLEAEKRGGAHDLDQILRLQAMKTGALIAAACEAGAVLGGADARARAAVARFGAEIGLMFQLVDDLLDATGDAHVVGKATAKDAARGKATLVSLLGIDGARGAVSQAEARAIAILEPFGPRAAVLADAARHVARRDR